MTPGAVTRLYLNAQRYLADGAGVVLLPGELDGEYTIGAWAWAFTPPEIPLAFNPDPRIRAWYLCKVAMNVREHFEVEHGLQFVGDGDRLYEECGDCGGEGRLPDAARCSRCKGAGVVLHDCPETGE